MCNKKEKKRGKKRREMCVLTHNVLNHSGPHSLALTTSKGLRMAKKKKMTCEK